MKLPHKHRSDEWVFGALLASVLSAAAGLHGAWLGEAHPADAVVAHVPTAARAPAPGDHVAQAGRRQG